MKYRKLGKTGLEVSEIGFGAWGIGGPTDDGGFSYGKTDDEVSKKALRCAYDAGVNFYDTSDIYGYGHSEKLIGEALGDVRNKIIIASKVGYLRHDGPHDFSEDHIRKSVEGSLKRLNTDYIDVYQLHSPPLEEIRSGNAQVILEKLKDEGLIKAVSVSLRNPADGLDAVKAGFESIQVNLNMIDHRAIENGLLDLAMKNEVGIIARTPLSYGFLTGSIKNLQFGKEDHRSEWSEEQLKRWADAPDLFSFVNKGHNRTPAQLALKFCLSFDAVSTTIPGMLTCAHVEENTKAPDVDGLTEEETRDIKTVYESNVFFDPKAKKTH